MSGEAEPSSIKDAALLYCTDRKQFLEIYKDTLHNEYLPALFLHSGTRPDLAEHVPLWVLGHETIPGTHGFDGLRNDGRLIECKTGSIKNANNMSHFGNIQINDVSEKMIARYDHEMPEIAIFEIHWKGLRPYYVEALTKKGRKSVSVSRNKWEHFAMLRYRNKDDDVLKLTPTRFYKLLYNERIRSKKHSA
jgi:hypothetical protein